MSNALINELLDFQDSILKSNSKSRLEKYRAIWKIADTLSDVLPSSRKKDILSKFNSVIENLELWQVDKVTLQFRVLIVDILEALPREARWWNVETSSSSSSFYLKPRTRSSNSSWWCNFWESSSESSFSSRNRSRTYECSWESSYSRWES